MGQNLALNIAEKSFPISVYNRTTSIVDETLERAAVEGNLPVSGQYSPRDFVLSLRIQSDYYRGAVGGMLVIILIGAFMKGRGVGVSGVGRTIFPLLQHRKATSKGPAKKLATLQKQDGDDFKESVEGD
uniref:6-phosphogluconate dehydrogenase NADP-binding domain-containing protein n=1 Tax=Brassica oleracea var. oleracea TaxID=109376 RepID=A0A0D3A148_BRAOL